MSSAIAFFLATIITLPLLGWYLIYIITVKITKKKSFSVRLAADLSAILFMASVYFIMLEIWKQSFIWVIFSLFFFVAIFFTVIHWKNAEDIHVWKLFKGIWRFNFILFFLAYFLLSAYGLITRIIGS